MTPIFNFYLLLASVTLSASSDFSLKGDTCSKLDRCNSKSVSKTCSCDSDCHAYGTCCHDVSKHEQDVSVYRCYDRRTINPVFVKRSCLEEFRGHVGIRRACFDDSEDIMDVKNNLLVTGRGTKVTYWNKHCAACNNEAANDLDFWDIVVFCPSHKEIDKYLIRRNLTFDQDKLQWGLLIGGEFLQCYVKYSPPYYVDEVKYCTPNVIANCSADYNNEAISTKCSQYYAKRKLKNSNIYFKNLHCALCNGADAEELECPAMSSSEDTVEVGEFRDMVEEIFTGGEWLRKEPGKRFECSRGFAYDPFREKCRRDEIKEVVTMISSSAHEFRKESLATSVTFAIILFKMAVLKQLFPFQQSV